MIKDYEQPFIVTMTGFPGSGKTHMSRQISRQLKIFLLSNDFIRNYYTKNIKSNISADSLKTRLFVKRVNVQRFLILLEHRKSFVYDAGLSSLGRIKIMSIASKIFRYKLIKVKINSNDHDNLMRLSKRKIDFDFKDELIIGDNSNYSGSFSEETYQVIKERKPILMTDDFFDYNLINTGSLSYFDSQINDTIEDIKLKVKKK